MNKKAVTADGDGPWGIKASGEGLAGSQGLFLDVVVVLVLVVVLVKVLRERGSALVGPGGVVRGGLVCKLGVASPVGEGVAVGRGRVCGGEGRAVHGGRRRERQSQVTGGGHELHTFPCIYISAGNLLHSDPNPVCFDTAHPPLRLRAPISVLHTSCN